MRIQIEHESSSYLLGFAKTKLTQLRGTRISNKLNVMQRFFQIDPFLIHIITSELGDIIRILGYPTSGQILLVDGKGALSVYNYLSDSLNRGAAVGSGVSELHTFYRRINHADTYRIESGRSVSDFPSVGEFVGKIYDYELDIRRAGDVLYAAHPSGGFGTWLALATPGLSYLPGFSAMQAALFNEVFRASPFEVWNFYQGPVWLGINPASRGVSETSRWVPSIFYAEPGNGFYTTGWYYGLFGGWGANFEPAEEIEVEFLGLMDCHYPGADRPYGYCECLVSLDGSSSGMVSFFLTSAPNRPPTSTFTNLSLGTVYGGSELRGYDRAITYTPFPGETPSVSWWNFQAFINPGFLGQESDNGVGLVFSISNRAKVYRWRGAGQLLMETEEYISHAVSNDGKLLAVFEGPGALITNVRVFDLYGESEIDLRDSQVVLPAEGVLGAWIPGTDPSAVPLQYALGDGASSAFAYTDGDMPPLAVMEYPDQPSLGGYPVFHNLIVEGTTAFVSDSDDECFESTIVRDPDYSGDRIHHGEPLGTIAGKYSGLPGSVIFEGAGSGLVRTQPTLVLAEDEGSVDIIGALGEVAVTNVDPDTGDILWENKDCNGDLVITASTSCNQSAELTLNDPVEALAITGTYILDRDTNTLYTVTGGIGPYTWEYPDLTLVSLSEDGSQITVIDDSPYACGTVDLTVTDSCGNSVTAELLAEDGQWVKVDEIDEEPGSCGFTALRTYFFDTGGGREHWIFKQRTGQSHPCDSAGCGPSYDEYAYDRGYDSSSPSLVWLLTEREPDAYQNLQGDPLPGACTISNPTSCSCYYLAVREIYEWQCP